jgi:hypothetical protein
VFDITVAINNKFLSFSFQQGYITRDVAARRGLRAAAARAPPPALRYRSPPAVYTHNTNKNIINTFTDFGISLRPTIQLHNVPRTKPQLKYGTPWGSMFEKRI